MENAYEKIPESNKACWNSLEQSKDIQFTIM